jgi:hypothetical protein
MVRPRILAMALAQGSFAVWNVGHRRVGPEGAPRASGDDVTYFELLGADHMSFLDPLSEGCRQLMTCLTSGTPA